MLAFSVTRKSWKWEGSETFHYSIAAQFEFGFTPRIQRYIHYTRYTVTLYSAIQPPSARRYGCTHAPWALPLPDHHLRDHDPTARIGGAHLGSVEGICRCNSILDH